MQSLNIMLAKTLMGLTAEHLSDNQKVLSATLLNSMLVNMKNNTYQWLTRQYECRKVRIIFMTRL